MPRRNVRHEFQQPQSPPQTRALPNEPKPRSPVPLPPRHINSDQSPQSIGNSSFSRRRLHFQGKSFNQRKAEQNDKIRALLDVGVKVRELPHILETGNIDQYLHILQEKEIAEKRKRDERKPLPTIKSFSGEAYKALRASSGRIDKALKASPGKIGKAMIKSPLRVINKCGVMLHLRKYQPTETEIEESRIDIENWEKATHRGRKCWKPPRSFEKRYPITGPDRIEKCCGEDGIPLVTPRPARPDTPIRPEPPAVKLEKPVWIPYNPNPPSQFRNFANFIGLDIW